MLHIRLFCEAVFPTASGTGTVGGLEYAPVYHNHDPDSQATAPTHLSDMYKSNDEVGLPTNTHCVGALGLGRAWDRKRLGFRYALPLYCEYGIGAIRGFSGAPFAVFLRQTPIMSVCQSI